MLEYISYANVTFIFVLIFLADIIENNNCLKFIWNVSIENIPKKTFL